VNADNTHLKEMGAMVFAQLAADEISRKEIMKGYLHPSMDIIVNTTRINFGEHFTATNNINSISLTGLGLSPENGIIMITAPDGFAVSISSSGTFTSSIQIPYTGGKLLPMSVYINFKPSEVKEYSGNLVIKPGSGTLKSIPLSGRALSAANGSVESTIVYSLTNGVSATATGPVICSDQILNGLYVKNYASSGTSVTWNPDSTSPLLQRLSITGDSWPTESDFNSSRYAEFITRPASEKTLYIDSISLYAGGAGGNNMSFRVQYSIDNDFINAKDLAKSTNNSSNTMNLHAFTSVIVVQPGQSLHLRIYPWYKSAASGKYFCLQNVVIHGMVK
jgi:hypothetical protein